MSAAGSLSTGSNVRNPALDLVHAALDPKRDCRLVDLLEKIGGSVGAIGCVLWEAVPPLHGGPGAQYEDSLYVLESWIAFEGHRFARHDLPISGSIPGRAFQLKKVQVENQPLAELEFRVPDRPCSLATCALPVVAPDANEGVLSVYRPQDRPFTEADVELLTSLALLLLPLYQALRDRVSYALLKDIEREIHESDIKLQRRILSREEKQSLIQRICELLAPALSCLEVSIFLNDWLEDPNNYRRVGSILGRSDRGESYRKTEQGDGLTGWVLYHSSPIRIFDLKTFEEDRTKIRKSYENITWGDRLGIKSVAMEKLELDSEDQLPPLSVMMVPIRLGAEAIGVIRCAVARGPYYFANRDERLLKVVADQIAQCWSIWLSRREVQEENNAWHEFIQGTQKLNDFVQVEADRESPDELSIFEEALRLIKSVVPGLDGVSIRVLNEGKRCLQYAGTLPRDPNRYKVTFPLDGPGASVGAEVMRTGTLRSIPDLRQDGPDAGDAPSGARRIIVAPLTHDNAPKNRFGVIDLWGSGEREFPRYAEQVAALLGRQLGMYHRLVTTIIDLRQQQKARLQAWKDLSHQLKSPVLQAKKRADLLLREMTTWKADHPKAEAPELNSQLFAIRGLCRKAKRVTISLGLLESFASPNPINLDRKQLKLEALVKMLIEASMDNQVLIDPRRGIKFGVDSSTLDVPGLSRVEADVDLLEQAVGNLLDNAGKYSYDNTSVRIFGGLTNKRQFHISVVNKGIKIAPHEVRDCVRREWRSEQAKLLTQEGSGIGLWIVDQIMKVHGGSLVIVPTTPSSLTEVKLVFPVPDLH
jgi:signal transduction histidine kinase